LKTKFLIFCCLLFPIIAQANPLRIYEPHKWESIAPLIQEDLTIEVFEKFSRMTGTFKFGPAKDTKSNLGLGYIKLPVMLSAGQDIYSNFLHYKKISVKCGDKTLRYDGGNSDKSFTHWLQDQLKTKEVTIQDVQFDMYGCNPDAPITITYEQKNFPIEGKRMMVYLPVLPGIDHREDRFKITLINKTNYNLELKTPKKYAGENVATPVTIQPLHKELITALLSVPHESLSEPIPEDTPKELPLAFTGNIDQMIHFGRRSSQIPPDSFPILDDVFGSVKTYPDTKIEIQGFCDAREAKGQSGIKLSEARAQAVKDYLVSKGVRSENLSILGYGSSRPFAIETSEEGRSKNRRVEFNVIREKE